MKVPYPWTIDRSLPGDVFSWDEHEPPLCYSEEITRYAVAPAASRTIGYPGEDCSPMAEIVWAFDERFGTTSRQLRDDGELVWVTPKYEIRVSETSGVIYVEGTRAFAPEIARLEQLFLQSPLASVPAELKACGDLFSMSYSVWSFGLLDWTTFYGMNESQHACLVERLRALGFDGPPEEAKLGDQTVRVHEEMWSIHIESGG